MFCRNCGARITDESTRFCPSCGEPFTAFRKKGPTLVEKIFWVVAMVAVIGALIFLLNDERPKTTGSTGNSGQMPARQQEASAPTTETKKPQPIPRAPGATRGVSPRIVSADSLNREITEGLKDFRYTLDLKYLRNEEKYRITAVLIEEGRKPAEYLDGFSRFFAACYGNADHPVEVASILVRDDEGTDLMAMGIGGRIARSLPTTGWQRFSGMGTYLASWVRENANPNPTSPEDACYYRKSDNF